MEEKSNQNYDRTSYILVVDDDNSLLKFFKIHLNKFFSKVIVVKNAKEAIDTIRDKKIDLVISDVNMPKVDGITLMKKIRKKDQALPILLISGALVTKDQENEIKTADGYLRKPFSIDELHGFISSGMEKRGRLSQLSELLKSPKQLRNLIDGKIKLERVVQKEKKKEAEALLEDLHPTIVNAA